VSTIFRPRGARQGSCRSLRATAVAVVVSLVPAACRNSKEATIDTASLTRAAASLALAVGELVERYAAELPTGDEEEDKKRLRLILTDSADELGFDAVGGSFAAAAARKAGNGKVQTALQMQAAARLANEAFRPPLPDYKPGDQAMMAAIASRLEPQLNAALTSTFNLETGRVKMTHLDSVLADAVSFVLAIAGYNYAPQNGSHPIRDRMRSLGMRAPPAEFIDQAGDLRLPHGSEPDDQISRFEDWRLPSVGEPNPLWEAVAAVSRGEALSNVFDPTADKAFG
jgi:hypothetical protein